MIGMIFLDSREQPLQTVNLTSFNKDLAQYDQSMTSFNEVNTYKNKIDRFLYSVCSNNKEL